MKRAALLSAAVFVALLPLGWPVLPWNMQPGDLLFPVLVVSAIGAGWRTTPHPLDLFVAAYLLGSLASVPGSLSRGSSWLAMAKEIYVAGIYVMTAVAAQQIGAGRLCRWLTRSVVALCTLSLAAAAAFYVTGFTWRLFGDPGELPYIGTVFRVWGAVAGPELFGNLLTFVIPLVLLDGRSGANAARRMAATALVVGAQVMTFSLTLCGFAAAAAVAVWPSWRDRPFSRAVLALTAFALVIVVNVAAIAAFKRVEVTFGKNPAIAPSPSFPYIRQNSPSGADLVDVRVSYFPMSYYVIKKVAWSAFLAHPVTGIGIAAFPVEAERAYDDGRLYSPYQHVEAHSTPFGRLAETGLVGTLPLMALFTALTVYALRAARSARPDNVVAWAVAAGCAGLLVNSLNVDMMNFRFLWFGAGVIRALTAPPMRA